VEYGKGFYGPEPGKTWRWMSGEGTVRLPSSDRTRKLTIAGNVVEGPFPRRPTVTIKFNGTTLEAFSAPKGLIRKEYTLTPAQQGANGWSELHLHTDLTAVPREFLPGSGDTRSLGFKLHELRWEGEPAAAPPARDTQPPAPRWPLYLMVAGGLVLLLASASLGWGLWKRRAVGMQPPSDVPSVPQPAGPAVTVACSQCGKGLRFRPELAGKRIKCPQCGQTVRLPEDAPGMPPTTPGKEHARTTATGQLGGVAVLVLLVGLAGLYFVLSPPRRPSVLNVSLGTETVPGVEESGFYNQEIDPHQRPFRWTDGQARLIIPLDRAKPPRALRMQLYASRPSQVPPTTLRILVNGQELCKDQFPPGPWERTLDLNGADLGETLTLDILSNTFVPQEVSGSNSPDDRPLGVQVCGIQLIGSAE
jgi:hypothetical protein